MTDTTAKQLGQTLAAHRAEAGLSRAEVGQRIGVSERTVARWEAGRGLTLERAEQLSKAIGREIQVTLEGKPG